MDQLLSREDGKTFSSSLLASQNHISLPLGAPHVWELPSRPGLRVPAWVVCIRRADVPKEAATRTRSIPPEVEAGGASQEPGRATGPEAPGREGRKGSPVGRRRRPSERLFRGEGPKRLPGFHLLSEGGYTLHPERSGHWTLPRGKAAGAPPATQYRGRAVARR